MIFLCEISGILYNSSLISFFYMGLKIIILSPYFRPLIVFKSNIRRLQGGLDIYPLRVIDKLIKGV